METCYINGLGCISAQHTSTNNQFLNEIIIHDQTIITAINPNYKEFISPVAARRMAKGVKMGIVASHLALQEAQIEMPDAIITGTGLGCLQDSEKFVSAMIDNDEEYLTPTSFIQSTHNTVGAQIALGLKCKAYNFTYVNSAVSFESCLIDAQLKFNENEAAHILVGGVDEYGKHTYKLHQQIGHIKKNTVDISDFKNATTQGTIFGEGACFFVLSNQKNENSYAKLTAVEIINQLAPDKLNHRIETFLQHNHMSIQDIDAVVLGKNGDTNFDHYYTQIQNTIFTNKQQIFYKHLCGEYHTASSFGLWVATKMIKHQEVPEILQLNTYKPHPYKNILLYNQYRGKDHSLILIQSC